MTQKEFINQGQNFLKQMILELSNLNIETQGLVIDHLCFRVATNEEYLEYKKMIGEFADLLIEAEINKRPIATYLLSQPIEFEQYKIDVIELPAPKVGVNYRTGFEHLEIVTNQSFDLIEKKYPQIQFFRSNHNLINPELAFKTKSGQIKFHHQTLKRIIEIEKSNITDIIFDLDSTLVSSKDFIYQINQEVFSAVLERQLSIEEVKEKYYPEFPKLFEVFEVTCEQKKLLANRLWTEVSKKYSHPLYEGVYDLLKALKELGYRLHIWTARDKESAEHILDQHGVASFFETMSFSNDKSTKPHTEALTFPWGDRDPGTYIMVGDSYTDIKGAHNIRAFSIGALWDSHLNHHELLSHGADICFFSLIDLKNWLRDRIKR